jgi:hypothetical protein
MRTYSYLFTLILCVAFIGVGCSSKPPADNSSANSDAQNAPGQTAPGSAGTADNQQGRERKEARERKREPIVVAAGTAIDVRLGSALGSKLSQAGQTFSGSVAKDVLVGGSVAIPQGATVNGTVTDAKPLGKFAGGAVLQVRLDSINLNGSDIPVQTALRTFSQKGKGKRTAVLAGGGAALGGLIGGLAGGGKGAAIGLAAGGGAGAGGAALTGNKDIVLPSESAISFELSQALELHR